MEVDTAFAQIDGRGLTALHGRALDQDRVLCGSAVAAPGPSNSASPRALMQCRGGTQREVGEGRTFRNAGSRVCWDLPARRSTSYKQDTNPASGDKHELSSWPGLGLRV